MLIKKNHGQRRDAQLVPDTLEGRGECVSDHELYLESSLYHQNYVADGKPKKNKRRIFEEQLENLKQKAFSKLTLI